MKDYLTCHIVHDFCKELLHKEIDNVNENIKILEEELGKLISDNYLEESKNLKSIIGVGNRISTAMLGHFGKFENFESAKKVISFVGLDPAQKQSGSSLNRPGRIFKKGSGYLRKILYLGAMAARRFNPYCKALFDRLIQKGKAFKVAIVSVANKLLRQIFAILKNSTSFDPNYLKDQSRN